MRGASPHAWMRAAFIAAQPGPARKSITARANASGHWSGSGTPPPVDRRHHGVRQPRLPVRRVRRRERIVRRMNEQRGLVQQPDAVFHAIGRHRAMAGLDVGDLHRIGDEGVQQVGAPAG